MIMKHPIKDFTWGGKITQLFGVNAPLYARFNIPGHNGIDYRCDYGEPILAAHDGVVSELYYENTWRTTGNGIYLQDGDIKTVYWHLSEIQCVLGQKVKQGDIIGLAGNTGFVKPEPTQDNPHAGTHLHFAIRKQVNNNYNGFVDPTLYLFKFGERLPLYFARDLFIGRSGDDVSWLQTCLKLEGFAHDYEPLGYFGQKTLRDVINLQKKYNLEPAWGYVGPKTRKFLMGRFSIY